MTNPHERGGLSNGVRATNPIERGVLELASRPVHFADVEAVTYLGGVTFERLQMSDLVLQLMLDTAEARDRAISYRRFTVGAGAWITDYPRFGRAIGYNLKFDETSTVNLHAEDLVRQKAADLKFRSIATLCIIGPPREDPVSGRLTPTLPPCGRCRDRLTRSPLVTDDTLFVMARPDFKVVQMGGLADIRRAHWKRPQDTLTTFTYKTRPEVFKPRPKIPANGYAFTTQEIESVDSTVYDDTIGKYLIERYHQKYMLRGSVGER